MHAAEIRSADPRLHRAGSSASIILNCTSSTVASFMNLTRAARTYDRTPPPNKSCNQVFDATSPHTMTPPTPASEVLLSAGRARKPKCCHVGRLTAKARRARRNRESECQTIIRSVATHCVPLLCISFAPFAPSRLSAFGPNRMSKNRCQKNKILQDIYEDPDSPERRIFHFTTTLFPLAALL